MRRAAYHFFVLLLALGAATPAAERPPRPPGQPPSGPGGAEYAHEKVAGSRHGQGDLEYWLFEPDEPKPESAPVVVLLHGWSGVDPAAYGAWIGHIVRRGSIVVYPRYQARLLTPPQRFTPNAIAAVQAAWACLQEDGHVKPDRARFAVVGHSAGALVAANMAALAAEHRLPQPRVVMCVQPGRTWGKPSRLNVTIPLADMRKVPKETLLLALAGDADAIVGSRDARRIIRETVQVPPENKCFVIVRSDGYGKPALLANHFSPCARDAGIRARTPRAAPPPPPPAEGPAAQQPVAGTVDALDYYAYWKLFDALCDAAFEGKNREYALGDTPEQRFMGKWSDGRPVVELVVANNPDGP